MGVLFGGMGKSRDINDIVDALQTGSIVNETVSSTALQSMEVSELAESIKTAMLEHYTGIIPHEQFQDMLKEDAESAALMFKNGMVEYQSERTGASNGKAMNESIQMPNLVTLTTSIATTMRTPYEAVLHRLFDTRTLEKQTVDVEEVIPTITAPLETRAEDMIDALSPYAPVPFVDRTEIMVNSLVNGIEVGAKDMFLLEGMDPIFTINRDVRVVRVDAELDGKPVDPKNISIAKGSMPYFEAKNNDLVCLFNIKRDDGTVYTADVQARMDFEHSELKFLRADPAITKVYFYATVSHQEHTHPIHTSFRNSFEQFVVPTRPHVEVSLPPEAKTDISNQINHFANKDIITAMTEQITEITSRMEDQRLKKCLDNGWEMEATFPFEAPSNFAHGNLEWLKREFVPFLDQCALKLKSRENITDCHFRVGVSPYILRILDTDFTMDKAMSEESRGAGVINYSIGIKTSTSVFYLISSQQFEDNRMQMLLIPNNWKMSQVKTYNYFKYSSYLTDQLRRADHPVQPAIVYTERNMPIVFRPMSAIVEIEGMPTMMNEGARSIRLVERA
ncbi:MAG: hypothetical protein NC489_08645 [Ruminococcus flavefaciens]|nr:hypothetical protein [Ruminococcus flavefaciens]